MHLNDWQIRLIGVCHHYGFAVPFLPPDMAESMSPDTGSEAAFGRVWCAALASTMEEDLEEALTALAQADPTPFDSDEGFAVTPETTPSVLAAFGVSLPRRGRGRPIVDYMVSGPRLHLEVRLGIRDRPEDLHKVRRVLLAASTFAAGRWNDSGPREALVLGPLGAAHGPLGPDLPSHRWFDDHEIDRPDWDAVVAGDLSPHQ